MKFLKYLNLKKPIKGQVLAPEEAMKLAVSQALKGVGSAQPNPYVGCVVTDSQHSFLSCGYHQVYGEAHAEVNALKGLSDKDLEGAHVYVTLEPCAHQGKTPSCAKLLATKPIASVIYGLKDPFKKVNGKGVSLLNEAGIKTGLLKVTEALCQSVVENFIYNQKNKLPFVAIKMATSLDGKMCLNNGDSRWITNKKSRALAHWFRAYYDATAIGVGTLLADDPRLNIRLKTLGSINNKIIIFDEAGDGAGVLKSSKLLECHSLKNIYVVTSFDNQSKYDSMPGLHIIGVNGLVSDGSLDLSDALVQLYDSGVSSIMVEGGPGLISSFISQKSVQRSLQFMAPKILGSGKSYGDGFMAMNMSETIHLKETNIYNLNSDLLVSSLFS